MKFSIILTYYFTTFIWNLSYLLLVNISYQQCFGNIWVCLATVFLQQKEGKLKKTHSFRSVIHCIWGFCFCIVLIFFNLVCRYKIATLHFCFAIYALGEFVVWACECVCVCVSATVPASSFFVLFLSWRSFLLFLQLPFSPFLFTFQHLMSVFTLTF